MSHPSDASLVKLAIDQACIGRDEGAFIAEHPQIWNADIGE